VCPVASVSALLSFGQNKSFFWGTVLIIIGLIVVYLNKRLARPFVAISGFAFVMFTITLLLYSIFLITGTNLWIVYSCLAMAFFAAAIASFLLVSIRKFGSATLSCFCGVIIGVLL